MRDDNRATRGIVVSVTVDVYKGLADDFLGTVRRHQIAEPARVAPPTHPRSSRRLDLGLGLVRRNHRDGRGSGAAAEPGMLA